MAIVPRVPRPYHRWTPEEDALLRDLLLLHTISEIVEILKRPRVSINSRCHILGIYRPSVAWSPEQDGTCRCGCGAIVTHGRKFASGHNLRLQTNLSEQHRKNIGSGQKRAWDTKRKRLSVGAKSINKQGYVIVKVIPGKGAWKLEHVIVVEEKIGRKINRGEHIHHINGVRTDNAVDNLYLCRNQHEHTMIEKSLLIAARQLLQDGFIVFNLETRVYERTN